MRFHNIARLPLIAALLLIALVACNSSSEGHAASSSNLATAYRLNSEQHPLSPALEAAQGYRHIVMPDENLSIIAEKYNTDWVAIAELNALADPDQLQVSQHLIVPVMRGGYLIAGHQHPDSNIPEPYGNGKRIVVSLSQQHIYAYNNGSLLYDAQISTGLPDTPTVQGEFAIYAKYEVQTMRGPGYDFPRVPFVLYFFESYSLHGTYWHTNFGHPMSHGCINLAISDARWFYHWAELETRIIIKP